MEAILIKGGGGGVTSDDVTAKANDVLKGTSTLTSDSNDEVTEGTLELTGDAQAGDVLAGSTFYNTDAHTKQTGTIPRNGEISGSLNCGESKKIPAGYTTGGTITATDLASQTGGATAADGNVLTGKTYWKDGVKRTGTMPERGAVSQELAAGGSYTVPEGHHDGAGRVVAKSLASQTGGATATDSTVLDGKTYWKDGAKRIGNIKSLGGSTITPSASAQTVSCSGKYMTGNVTVNAISGLNAAYILKGKVIGGVTGTLAVQSAISFSAAALSYNKIRISWKNPARGPWQGVFIQMSTSGNPGTGGGTRKYTGAGNNPNQAGGSNYVDIGGLNMGTTYYFTCTSYCDALGWGSSYNVAATTKGKILYDNGYNPYGMYDSYEIATFYPTYVENPGMPGSGSDSIYKFKTPVIDSGYSKMWFDLYILYAKSNYPFLNASYTYKREEDRFPKQVSFRDTNKAVVGNKRIAIQMAGSGVAIQDIRFGWTGYDQYGLNGNGIRIYKIWLE